MCGTVNHVITARGSALKRGDTLRKCFANRSVAWFKVSAAAAAIAISYDFAWHFPPGSRSPYESPYVKVSTRGSAEKREPEREGREERGEESSIQARRYWGSVMQLYMCVCVCIHTRARTGNFRYVPNFQVESGSAASFYQCAWVTSICCRTKVTDKNRFAAIWRAYST